MYKKIFSTFLILSMLIVFSSCDVSKKIHQNQTEIAQLKETVRLLRESVGNYERVVKRMSAEIDVLKKQAKSKRR